MESNTPATDLLNDVELELEQEPAGTGQRFTNFIIDTIALYASSYILGILLGIVLMAGNHDTSFLVRDSGMSQLIDFFSGFLLYALFYSIAEGLTRGRSPGKYVTGTRVIREDGSRISFKDALMRSLSRLVPFEAFSALGGTPWHDTWTNTKVVKIRK
ncbi:RDD family protein [Flavihumibacter stibioxidans]|uniref:RDD domain-containing protein n=1 Tax=Flavihumibacter stibioxidans TaxID=1834163 RepID=A0ABR7M869_9BACT|nr:RDD family protein [Flavihumibacter stibioxidans]MBC6490734.1 hypothetical protein [Flavihumibacter stibioxidans]